MAISLDAIKNRLRPYLLAHWSEEVLDFMTDDDFLNIFNDVANDLNEEAQINLERFYKETGSVNAEDDEYTNYLMAGDILKVIAFKYEGSDWETQYYSYIDDRIILKVSPSEGTQMDIKYIRKCEDLVDSTDEVDLPDTVIPEYVELLKKRLLVDYGPATTDSYESALIYYGQKALSKIQMHVVNTTRIRRFWMRQMDDSLYHIEDHYISLDNFVSDSNGNYHWVDSDA